MYSSPSRPKHPQATTVNYTPGIYDHQGAVTGAVILSTSGIYESNRTRGLVIAVVDTAGRLNNIAAIADDVKQVISTLNKTLVKTGGWYVGQILIPLNARHPLTNTARKDLANSGITIIQPVWAAKLARFQSLNLEEEARHALRFHNQKQAVQREHTIYPARLTRPAHHY